MAERRAAGFNIPLNFYDGAEVESIPKRIRAAAVGVWALAGDYAATHLTDGYVPAGTLKGFGCTDSIRAALKITTNKRGELSPLWIDAKSGGVQLTNWPKHQRTNAEVTSYREAEAERKRRDREAKNAAREAKVRAKFDGTNAYLIDNFDEGNANEDADSFVGSTTGNATTSTDGEMSGRTTGGRSTAVRTEHRDPKTETETETKSLSVETSGECVTSGDARDRTHTDSAPPKRFCAAHPNGTRARCGDCANARTAFDAWSAERDTSIALAETAAENERQLRRKLIDSCPLCDDFGRLDDLSDCNHQEAQHA